jgi:hypothetical protein
MKIGPVGADFNADGQIDMTKLIVAFRNFANASENGIEDCRNYIYRLIYKGIVLAELLKAADQLLTIH